MPEPPDHPLRTLLSTAVADGSTAVADGVVPGAALAVGVRDRCLLRVDVGGTDTAPQWCRPLASDTLFDLASLTKVLATMPAVLALADAGELSLDDPLTRHLPAFSGDGREEVTIGHLLTHTSGLPASRRYYRFCASADDMLRAVLAEPLEALPGTRVAYSDLGFLLLGELIRARTGQTLPEACAELVHRPLGMTGTGYPPLPDRPVAATTEPGAVPAPGQPHDRNARLYGGAAGHAGLFAPLTDVARFAAWWVSDDDGPVSRHTRVEAARCRTEGLGGSRGWGWMTRGDGHDFLPENWPATAAMHTGFTGTSVALDPVRGWWVCLLTNAIHLGRDRPEVGELRTEIHRLAVPLLASAGC